MLWDEHGPANLALESTDSDRHYELVITRTVKEVDGGLDHYTKAEVTRTDLQRKIVQRVDLRRHFA